MGLYNDLYETRHVFNSLRWANYVDTFYSQAMNVPYVAVFVLMILLLITIIMYTFKNRHFILIYNLFGFHFIDTTLNLSKKFIAYTFINSVFVFSFLAFYLRYNGIHIYFWSIVWRISGFLLLFLTAFLVFILTNIYLQTKLEKIKSVLRLQNSLITLFLIGTCKTGITACILLMVFTVNDTISELNQELDGQIHWKQAEHIYRLNGGFSIGSDFF